MAYRDDKRAMKQRIEQLEGELSTAQGTIARLNGHIDERASDDEADMLTKEQLHLTRELDFAIDDAGVEAIAEMLRTRLLNSQVTEVGRTLSCRWGTSELRVIRHDDRTEIRLGANDPRPKWLMAVGGTGFAVLAGPFVAAAGLALASLVGVALPAWAAFGLVPVALGAGYWLMDTLTDRNIRNARTTLKGALESASDLAKEHEQKSAVRIDVTSQEDVAAEAEAEAAAEEEAAAHQELSR
jgi:hypothetical protein